MHQQESFSAFMSEQDRDFMSSPSDPLRITVEVTVEISHEESSTLHGNERPATPLDPVRPLLSLGHGTPEQDTTAVSAYGTQQEGSAAFTETALQTIAQYELRLFSVRFPLPDLPAGSAMNTIETTARLIWIDLTGLVIFGQRLLAKETLEDHAKAIAVETRQVVDVPADVWLRWVEPLKVSDPPLYHITRDSLHRHTPHHIFLRWCALRESMHHNDQTLALLIRQAEELPRRKWPQLVTQLYFLLLDHNQVISDCLQYVKAAADDLQWQLSAYCMAVRIRFILWRMTVPNPFCTSRDYKRKMRAELFKSYTKQLSSLITRETTRMLHTTQGQFQNVRRKLVGEPVRLEDITEPLSIGGFIFCTICQEEHSASACVSPLNCECRFGRQCLQPMLNRDTPSSYTCPNCRTRLHEPLKWQYIETATQQNLQVGLMWALRSNAISLQCEIGTGFESFTPRQRIASVFNRIAYGG